jgi:hypothetical protein
MRRLEVKRRLVATETEKLNGILERKVTPSAGVTVDWRNILGVSEAGYKSPLDQRALYAELLDGYESVRAYHQAGIDRMEALRASWSMSEQVVESPDVAALRALGGDVPAPKPTRGDRLFADADEAISTAEGRIAELDAEAVDVRGTLDELGGVPDNPYVSLPVDQAAARAEADSLRGGMIDAADLMDAESENAYFVFEAAERAIEQLPKAQAEELTEIVRNKRLNGLLRKQNNALQREYNTQVKEANKVIKKFDGREYTADDMKGVVADFEELIRFVDVDTPEGRVAAAMYADFMEKSAQLEANKTHAQMMQGMLKAAKNGEFAQVFKRQANEGFVAMGEVLGPENMVAVAEPLARAIRNVEKSLDSGAFIETIELANRFFKTYATLSPGFHIRNLMGASFMNASEGVSMGNTRDAYRMVSQFKRDPLGYMNALRARIAAGGDAGRAAQREYQAMEAAFGSGASGRLDFGEIGKANAQSSTVRRAMDTKVADAALGNWAVRKSQSIGTHLVEMPMRVALALDSFDRGMDTLQAISRIKRVHFDYSELSRFDRKMKALIPFWIFMSRNLPLQMQQMLLKPKAYAVYNSLMRNFGAPNQDMLQWQEERQGWVLFNDSTLFSDRPQNVALLPDLQHVSMADDLEKMDPRNPLRFLSQMNPLARVPAEFALDRQFYKDRPFYNENKAEYALLQSVPPAAQAARLLGVGPYEDRSRLQSALNYVGVPLWPVDQDRMLDEMRRRAG